MAAYYFPPNLRFISTTILKHRMSRWSDGYDRFEVTLEHFVLCLPVLNEI